MSKAKAVAKAKRGLRDKTIAWLRSRGLKEVPSRTAKYTTFEGPPGRESSDLYFVGGAGAVRKGVSVSNSISLTGAVRGRIDAFVAANPDWEKWLLL